MIILKEKHFDMLYDEAIDKYAFKIFNVREPQNHTVEEAINILIEVRDKGLELSFEAELWIAKEISRK